MGSRPAPEFVKLDYWDADAGNYQRYLMENNDNVPAVYDGIMLAPPIETDKLKLRLVLPSGMKGDQHACMRFELYTCDQKAAKVKSPALIPTNHNPLQNGIPLEFSIVDNQETAGASYWTLFPFKFLSISDNLVPAYLYISRVEILWRVVSIENAASEETGVTVNVRTNVNTGDNEEQHTYQTNTFRWTKFTINRNSCHFVDILMLTGVKYQIRIQEVFKHC